MTVEITAAYLTPFMIHSSTGTRKPETLEEMLSRGDYISANFVLLQHGLSREASESLPNLEDFWKRLEKQYLYLTPSDSLNHAHIAIITREWNSNKSSWYDALQKIFSSIPFDKAG